MFILLLLITLVSFFSLHVGESDRVRAEADAVALDPDRC